MSKRYYTAKELAGLPGLPDTESGVTRLAKRAAWRFRKREGRGGGREYPETCLPQAAREHLQKRLVKQVFAAQKPEPSTGIEATPKERADLGLTEKQRAVKCARASILKLIEQLQQEAGLSKEGAIRLYIEWAATGQLDPQQRQQLDLARDKRGSDGAVPGYRTIQRWSNAEDLAPKPKSQLKHPVWAYDFLIQYRRPQKPTMKAAYRAFCAEWEGEPPSYWAVHRYVSRLPKILVEKGRMGPREIKALKPFVRRTFEDLWPNDVWSADGHTFDAEVQHPFHGQPFRPEITGIIDIATRYMVGFSVTLKESALTTADALRHACQLSGIPAIFYVDNGSGYANHLLKAESVGLLSRLGIEVKHSLPYNSQARGVIERSHRTIWVSLAKKLPSYMGAEMDPEAKKKFFKESRTGDKNGIKRLPIAWQAFMRLCEDAISEYNQRPHGGLPRYTDPVTGKRHHFSPAQYRQSRIETIPDYEHHELDAQCIDTLFRPREVRTVNRCEIRLFGNRYYSKDLVDYHGEPIQIGYDIHDAQRVWVYDEDGLFIARAEFQGNAQSYYPIPVIEQARDKRAAARKKNAERVIEEIEAERKGNPALEAIPAAELPGMRSVAKRIEERESTEQLAPIPSTDDPRARYQFWCDLDKWVKAGQQIEEAYRPFYKAFPSTAMWRSYNALYNGELMEARR